MDSSHHNSPNPNSLSPGKFNEQELEILVARYTLEYLYHWTNEFDAASLARFKQLFDVAGTPEALVNLLKSARHSLPN